MKLTLTIMNCEKEKDIQVYSQQKIQETLVILQKAGELWGYDPYMCKVKSARRGIYIDTGHTYEDELIYTGDILEVL
ncbi:MAG: hypothetical protein ACK5ML_09805 [Lachnospiraceae bacterium]